jgi:NRPS condensation-like uncharacterized protein
VLAIKVRTEAFDLMQNYYRTFHDPIIRCLIRFSGRLDAAALERAVDLSLSAAPPIACGFSPRTHGWVYGGFSAKDILSVKKCGAPEEEEQILLSGLNFEKGPQLKLFLIREGEGDALCAVMSHLVADGAGFKQYLYLLADLYSRCAENPDCQTAAKPGCRSLSQLLRGYSLREKAAVFSSHSDYARLAQPMPMLLKGDRNRPFLVRLVLEEEPFSRIRSYGKARGATVNDLLLTAYACALHRWTGCADIRFPCFVDMRKYLKYPQECGICNMTSRYGCRAVFSQDEPFEAALQKISASMSRHKESPGCLKAPALLGFLSRVFPRAVLARLSPVLFRAAPVSFTNIGVLEEGRLVFGDQEPEDAFLSTAAKYTPNFQVAVSTWNGRCSLCSSFHGTPEDQERIRSFLGEMERELVSAAASRNE